MYTLPRRNTSAFCGPNSQIFATGSGLAGREFSQSQAKVHIPDFLEALSFVNRVAELAEEQGHHPDISFGWATLN